MAPAAQINIKIEQVKYLSSISCNRRGSNVRLSALNDCKYNNFSNKFNFLHAKIDMPG